MARVATARKTTAQAATPRKAGPKVALAGRPPMVTKEELRASVEKLERANTALRAKGRETNKAIKAAGARIAELEAEVARLEKRLSAQAGTAKRAAKRTAGRQEEPAGSKIDHGDAVPPGVAVQEPEPLDEKAEEALENLEDHLGGGGDAG